MTDSSLATKVADVDTAWQDCIANGGPRQVEAQIRNTEPLVKFIAVDKSYDGRTRAVRDLTLDVAQGEFLTLLGPSGSGKTTTLNMLAGFERPTRGEILLGGRPVDRLPPYERNIGMVFQNYALFPHMTVGENVAFPLSVRRMPRARIAECVQRALAMVRLEAFSERRPAQLSGGQQQRIALARALVFEPSLVLMDEPLGALDKKLREHMQIEVKLLHERLGLTVVYVTHDQSEALTMSDRIAVFHDGRVMQQGTPDALYSQPRDAFVAGFIGENNILSGTAQAIANGQVRVALGGGLQVMATAVGELQYGAETLVAVRPESVHLSTGSDRGDNICRALVTSRIYLGDHQRLLTEIGNGHTITVKVPAGIDAVAGESVILCWNTVDCLAFPASAAAERALDQDDLTKEWRNA
ncbi:MAG TPA: ABC transporter ATP-binding protein [Acetobacteraceae bacterium]